jgi:putative transposase
MGMTAKVLGIPKASPSNWVRSSDQGQLGGAGDRQVTPGQMELARLRAELARVKMERDIASGGGVLCAGCSAKHAWIRTMKEICPLSLSC